MVRGSGKFKQKRGGGRSFSKDLGADGGPRNAHRGGEDPIGEEDSDEDSEEDSDEDSSEEESDDAPAPTAAAGSSAAAAPELTRQQRRDMKKKLGPKGKDPKAAKGEDDDGEEDDEDLVNPNHVQKKLNISDLGEPRELTRREREQKEKQDAKDRYWKLHVQGKTDEAKSDLSRLAKIRAEREAAQAKRQAETEARTQEAEAKRVAQLAKRK